MFLLCLLEISFTSIPKFIKNYSGVSFRKNKKNTMLEFWMHASGIVVWVHGLDARSQKDGIWTSAFEALNVCNQLMLLSECVRVLGIFAILLLTGIYTKIFFLLYRSISAYLLCPSSNCVVNTKLPIVQSDADMRMEITWYISFKLKLFEPCWTDTLNIMLFFF